MKFALEIGPEGKNRSLKDYEIYYLDFIKRDLKNFIKHNLNLYPYPFKENSFDLIIVENVIEHLIPATIQEELWIKYFSEIYRISKNNALVRITVPHYTNGMHIQHRINFSFYGFRELFEKGQWFDQIAFFNFKIVELKLEMNKLWRFLEPILNSSGKINEFWEQYLSYIFRAKKIHVLLKVVK